MRARGGGGIRAANFPMKLNFLKVIKKIKQWKRELNFYPLCSRTQIKNPFKKKFFQVFFFNYTYYKMCTKDLPAAC